MRDDYIPAVGEQPLKKRKSLSDYFPEEHILVTSGVVLFVFTMLLTVPNLGAVGFLPILTLGAPSAENITFPLDWAVWMVVGLVIIVMWVASQKKT
ncbi:MAG: hypothetical protein AABX02_04885 [archaeon]